ncbi:MAG TPA: haloacid dehalogenase type II [Candidatus Bathyarchaeia archaeon]|nr:haloacid dehalogenase type II [Candidatus Bathyarchaeia archaeon]
MQDLEVITFDCYGTLIDWETGIRTAFKQTLENLGLSKTEEAKVFDLYEKEERRIESETYRPYRRVLAEALSAAAGSIGQRIPERSLGILSEQLPNWRPFSDTNPALQRLAPKYKLGILSNVDNELLSGTLKHLSVPFDLLVTAEKVRSYKPRPKHFQEARKWIGNRGWLHVAASLYHDIEPACRLGINSVWVNRKKSSEGQEYRGKISREVNDLAQLADWLVR